MILPNKYISTRNSLLGVGGIILEHLNYPKTITSLWNEVSDISEIANFKRFTLTLDFLYIIGAIEMEEGLLRRCHT
ncbi:MAG: ABC-three component system middle component 6 [Waterburya sp.]